MCFGRLQRWLRFVCRSAASITSRGGEGEWGEKKTLFSTNLLTEGEKNKQEVGKKEKDVEVENFFYFCESLVGTTEPRSIVDL